jgi:outer membrane protein assembly factor BamB
MVPVAHAGLATVGTRAWLVGGETAPGVETADVQVIETNRAFGAAGAAGAGSPYFGDKLLIADRGNDRLLVLDDTGRTIWTYPSSTRPAPPGGPYIPDKAFFTDHGKAIISNENKNDTIVEIAYPSGRVLWVYGHRHEGGSAPGYLDYPSDAYVLRNGDITVADPMNCRVLVLSPRRTTIHQIGTPGTCTHIPPQYLGSPNGDTPLPDGNLLVSEVNGAWVDEFTPSGRLVWDVQLPIAYPSDPQPVAPDRYVVADYATPGDFVEFDLSGRILYRYGPSSGPGELDQPSLVERLRSGALMVSDDSHDRIVAIDPSTGALVWQYGRTGVAGSSGGLLDGPDGFDILGPGGTFPTHPDTG